MLSLNDLQNLIATGFLDGSMELAGIAMFIAVIMLVLGITKNTFMALLVGMGVTLFFSVAGILSIELTALLIVVSVLGLAYTSRNIWRD